MSASDPPNSRLRPERLQLLLLLGLSLTLRIGWIATQPIDDESIDRLPDQREYLALAQNLLHGEGLRFHDPRFRDIVYAFRMPGYPLVVAALRANVTSVRLAQALIDTSTVLAAYLLARRWLSRRASLFGAAVVGFNPFLIYFCGLVLSETVFTSMLIWGMFLVVRGGGGRFRDRTEPLPPKSRWSDVLIWLLGCLVLACSIHIRQSAIALPLFLAIGAAFVNRNPTPAYHRKWPLPVGTTMVLLTALVLLPWAWRNHRVFDSWSIWTTTNGGVTLYDGFNPDATGASDQSFLADMPELRAQRMNELQRDAYLRDQAKRFIADNPVRVVQLAVLKAARTWSPVPLSVDYGSWKYRVVGLVYTLPLDVLVILGLRYGHLPRSAKVFLLIPAIYFTGVHMLSVGSLRYRIPVEPPMAIVAASAAASVIGTEERFLSAVRSWKRAG